MVNVMVNFFFGISFFLEVANLVKAGLSWMQLIKIFQVNVAQCIMQIWSSFGKVTLKEIAFCICISNVQVVMGNK